MTTGQGARESRAQGEGRQVIPMQPEREVCQVQNAETLLGIIRERGKRGLPLKRVYPLLYQPGPVPARLRPPVRQPGGHDARYDPERPWTA